MRTKKESDSTAKKVPSDEYECFRMPCKECYYWDEDKELCYCPDVPPCNEN